MLHKAAGAGLSDFRLNGIGRIWPEMKKPAAQDYARPAPWGDSHEKVTGTELAARPYVLVMLYFNGASASSAPK